MARAAGVCAPTIYRRWATQSAMVVSALSHRFTAPSIQSAGDFDGFSTAFGAVVVAYLADAATRAAAPGLLVEYHREPQRYADLVVRIEDPLRELFGRAHADAAAEGVIAAEPSADALFDTIIAVALYHGVWRRGNGDGLTERIVDVVRSACRPTAGRPATGRRRQRRRMGSVGQATASGAVTLFGMTFLEESTKSRQASSWT